jgi:hypothetical protein
LGIKKDRKKMLGQKTTPKAPNAPAAAPAAPAQPPKTGLFAGLKNASVTVRGNKLTEGQYLVRVKSATWKSVRVPAGSYKFFLEFMVEKSNRPETIARFANESAADYEERCKKAPTAVGTTASWGQSCADAAVGFGGLKSFAAAITGSNPEDPAFIEEVEPFLQAVVLEGAINGWLLPVETRVTTTQKGFPWVVHTWGQRIDEEAGQ